MGPKIDLWRPTSTSYSRICTKSHAKALHSYSTWLTVVIIPVLGDSYTLPIAVHISKEKTQQQLHWLFLKGEKVHSVFIYPTPIPTHDLDFLLSFSEHPCRCQDTSHMMSPKQFYQALLPLTLRIIFPTLSPKYVEGTNFLCATGSFCQMWKVP